MNRTTRTQLSRVVMIGGALAFMGLLLAAFPAPPAKLKIDPAYFEDPGPHPPGISPGQSVAQDDTPPANDPNLPRAGRVNVLVFLDPALAPNAVERANVRTFAGANGGVVKYEYRTVLPHVLNLRDIPAGQVQALKNLPGVRKVELDEYHANLVKLDEATPLVNGLQSQISAAGLSADGAGIRVCVCDTGIDTDHLMYASRIDFAASFDFHNNDPDPEDDNGHGAHVSGIAVGGTGLSVDFGCDGSEPFQGVAPGATLIGVKILNSSGGGFTSNIIAGIDHCADQSPSGGRADVINLSIGTGNFAGICDGLHSWADAANNAVDAGVVVVAASGNECNSNSMGSPACGSKVIAVGATYKDSYPNCENGTSVFPWSCCVDNGPNLDDVVCFSNESDFLDVVAPGAIIWSASTAAGGGSITTKAGTSMSSPMVAGLAALVLDADPSLTPAQVRQIIRDGAIDMGAPGFDRAYGFGRIDVINTLQQVSGCTSDADCNDGDVCNGSETCDIPSGQCQSGTPLNCDDTDACTTDGCDPGTGCTNDPITCDDGDSCTSDSCDPGSGCVFTPVTPCCGNATCESGEDCNTCSADCISGGGGGSSCPNDVCEPGEDCNSCPDDCRQKTNGNPNSRYCCDGDLQPDCGDSRCSEGGFTCGPGGGGDPFCCGNGACEAGEDIVNCAVDCDVSCGSDAECDDGDACNGTETCNLGTGNCEAGTPINCDDGDACTADSCSDGACSNDPINCDDGDPCTTDSCDPDTGCVNTDPPCQDGDDCCPAGCNSDNDDDCCGGNQSPCTTNADCCSNKCKNGSCKGN